MSRTMTPSTAEQLHALLHKFDKTTIPALQQAAAAGDAEAQFKLGALHANGKGVEKDDVAAARWLEQAASQGWCAAQTLLGWFYSQGQGVGQDVARAMEYFQSAAEQGDADAQCALADLYQSGQPGVERNPRAMLAWYEAAASQEHPKAQYMLGKLLAEGELVAQNDEAAFQWLTLAIINHSEPAQKELALLTARLDSTTLKQYKERMLATMQPSH